MTRIAAALFTLSPVAALAHEGPAHTHAEWIVPALALTAALLFWKAVR